MRLVKPSFEILTEINRIDILKRIEQAGRTCYKSDSNYTEKSGSEFLKKIIKRGHLSVIEHVSITVKFICDRGVTHELVRHRLASYSQESTRYCNYSGGLTFIIPLWCKRIKEGEYCDSDAGLARQKLYGGEDMWFASMHQAEYEYKKLIEYKWIPQQARSVLPNALKTEIVTTANLREWKHIFSLRCSEAAHPQIREVMVPLREVFRKELPEIYG